MPQDFTRARKPLSRSAATGGTLAIKHILVPTDFSPASKKALEYAAKFAAQHGAKITVLNVLEPSPHSDASELPVVLSRGHDLHDAQQALDIFAGGAVSGDIVKAAHVCAGKPYEEIVKSAKNVKADLIIIAAHGHMGTTGEVIGSTTDRVVRLAPCPVLVVREKGGRK